MAPAVVVVVPDVPSSRVGPRGAPMYLMTERAQNYDTGLVLPNRLTYLILVSSDSGKCAVSVDLSPVGEGKDARFVGDRPTDLDGLGSAFLYLCLL